MSLSSRRSRFLTCSLLALGLAGAGAAHALPGMRAELATERTWLAQADDVTMRFSVTNEGATPIRLLKWATPFEEVGQNLFAVGLNGEEVRYIGKMYKRGTPQAKDYLTLAPGESLSTSVELSSLYDMSRPGEYTVQYRVYMQDALGLSDVDSRVALPLVKSNVVGVWREEAEGPTLWEANQETDAILSAEPELATRALTPTYVSCSSSRKSALVTALNSAQSYASNASSYLNAGTTGSRYTTWFGSYNSSRYSTVRSHFSSILSTIQTKTIKFNCTCTQNYYAYVYPGSPYEIFLCNAFWSAPNTGTDSRAGTLIHELSHFYVVASTDDWAYGQSACKSLATSNPSRATDNADSHEYFAENNPALN